jgi:uncharacterized protein YyaL (SSP411 family)
MRKLYFKAKSEARNLQWHNAWMNRLARERSPYLLQHAGNPVQWYPWGDDAFAKARAEDKPIFLSIGYSTCHWCHVMERESFESDAIATVLNEQFVPVKVDREERPDVDRVYMAFVQATTGSGGWPMSVWLTPELKPFYGGTYFPPVSKWGRPGFVDILRQIAQVWEGQRDKVRHSAEALTGQLRGLDRARPTGGVPGAEALERTVDQFRQSFDATRGGFGDAPKFPRPSELLFLLREHARTGDESARTMALTTLHAMALGGVRDHVGGGFHRYSVDGAWRVPHFEKMLYDQAQLVLAYAEGAQASGDPFYGEVAEDTLRYVMREMTDEAGGFHSAEDADSVPPEHVGDSHAHKAEGAFYLWTAGELDALLGPDAPVVKRRFGVAPDGNAPADPQQEFTGKNLLYVAMSVDELSAESGRTQAEVAEILNRARSAMYGARAARPRPQLDDKVLTAWNGLMIAAFARVGRLITALGPEGERAGLVYLKAAQRAATFIRERMWNGGTGTLLRRYRDGHAEIDAYAEDYAFLIFGLLELFQADPDAGWLDWAVALQRRQDELFWDDGDAGWFSTTGRDPNVLIRMKEDYDGAEPTASSIAVMNLLVLSHLIADERWTERIERTLKLFGTRLDQAGRAVPMMAAALCARTAGMQQIVIVGETGADALERSAVVAYRPFAITLALTPERQQRLRDVMPLVAAMGPIGGAAAAYVCRDFACRQPAASIEELEQRLLDA